MRKSFFALPLLAASFVFACGSADRTGYATFKEPTEPADGGDAGAKSGPMFQAGENDNDSEDAGGCAESSNTITRTPVVLQFVTDESGSMTSDNKWTAQRDALIASFEDMKNANDGALFVGLQLFDDTPNTRVKPKLIKDQDHFDDLMQIIDKPSPAGGLTGSEDALQAGYDIVEDFKPPTSSGLDTTNIKRIVIFMSDGAPSGGATEKTACEDLAAEKFAETPPAGPILTFSIGVGKFPGDSAYDTAFMGRLAQAGGTAPAGCDPASNDPASVCHFQITPGDDPTALKDAFIAAINTIRALSASCEFSFKLTGDANPNDIKVTMTTSDGKVKKIRKDPANGWTFDDENAPTKVILHGAACSASNGTVSGKIDIKFGCGIAK